MYVTHHIWDLTNARTACSTVLYSVHDNTWLFTFVSCANSGNYAFVDMKLGCGLFVRNLTPDATLPDKMSGEITSGWTNASFGR